MRSLFFAAFPDADTRDHLSKDAGALGIASPELKLLAADQYHLTLLFLGTVSDAEIVRLRVQGARQPVDRICLRFDRWEYWPEQRVVVAAAPAVPPALAVLRADLAGALTSSGFAFDDKPLRPHITVARKVVQAPVLHGLSEFAWTVSAYSLVASSPGAGGSGAGGSTYTVVDSWSLLDAEPRPRRLSASVQNSHL